MRQAEEYALANHPHIAAAQFNADAVRQEIREARSQFFPQVYAESDTVYAPKEARLAAIAGLNNPSVFSRQSDGVTVSQLVTDFGRTFELTESARFRADAAGDRVRIAQAVVVLEADRAYFDVLRAQVLLRVAEETVKARQSAYDQIAVLAKNQLRSILDANFADQNLSEAKLQLIQAQSGISNAEAELSTALGFADAQHFILAETPLHSGLSSAPEAFVQQALKDRPELASLQNDHEAAFRFAQAQDAARYPKVSALAAAGVNPVADRTDFKSTYYAAGINVELPVATGGKLAAQAKEAHLLADVATQNLIETQHTISRDVRMAWQAVGTAVERLNVTAELVRNAHQALQLAEARYRLGTTSIVELIQAQLGYTEAEVQETAARYDYQGSWALLDFAVGANRPGR